MRYVETLDAVPVGDLAPYPGNARIHAEAVLAESARTNGQYRSIVARRHAGGLQILAGHGTRAAFAGIGTPTVRVEVIEADDEEAARIVLVDNRGNDLAGYDEAALLDLLRTAQPDLAGTGFDQQAFDALVAELEAEEAAAAVTGDPDAAPDVPARPRTNLGDVWLLGPHRVICGDAGDVGALDAVLGVGKVGCVLTDPPYGMNLDTDYSKMPEAGVRAQMIRQPTKYRAVIGDDGPFDAGLLRSYFAGVREQFWFGADYYRRTLSEDDRDGSWLIWDKRGEDGSQDDVIGSGFEMCWTATPHQRRLLRHYWCGAFGSAEARNRFHPTQKPTALFVDILSRWAPRKCVVADPFGGSGSTLVAAHLTGRKARLIELDPGYVDVIARRWQTLTGVVPVLESSCEAVDFGG